MRDRTRTWTRVLAGLALVAAPILVTAGAAHATTSVSTEAALRTAYANAAETSINITANITLTNCGSGALSRSSGTALTVHGNGHTLHQTCATDTFDQSGSGALTFENLVNTMAANRDGVSTGTGTVTLAGSTINNVSGGDGISSGGNVVLTDSSINAVGDGDGVSTGGTVTLTRSAITGVTASGDGISTGGAVSLTQSHIDGAASGSCDDISTGGAVTLNGSTLIGCDDAISTGGGVTLTNSTITGAHGDAISTGGLVTLSFATIVGNGRGISGSSLTSFASVVAKSTDGDCSIQSHTSHGFNFDDDGSCGFDQSSDQKDAGDPGLGAVANNGGTAKTLLPQAGSPLLNKVPDAECNQATDERGVHRPQGSACDIGAVEVAVAGPVTTTTTVATAAVPTTVAPTPTNTVAPAAQLPRTGSSHAGGLAAIAVALIGAGGLLLFSGRRRRAH